MRDFYHIAVYLAVALCFLIFIAMEGCEPKTKQTHKVLSFLFDGVPPLTTPTPIPSAESQETGQTPGAETPQSVVFIHQPFKERQCKTCHDMSQESRIDTTSSLCFQCHEDDKTTKKIVHAPLAGGECQDCHAPHQSEFGSLLTRTMPDLCFECHDRTLTQSGVHTVIGEEACSACHDPHSSNAAGLFVAAEKGQICVKCHRDSEGLTSPMLFTHSPAKEGACFSCHGSHSQGTKALLVKQGKALCDECHNVPDRQADMLHAPVAAGACQICHDPHGSNVFPNLIVTLPELCFECHDQADVTGSELHALAGNQECTACHDPHNSDSPALLLVAARGQVCFNCHESSDLIAPDRMTHRPAKEGQCFACHSSHAQRKDSRLARRDFLLAREGKALCNTCHEIPEEEAATVHSPVATGDCRICHDPHGTTMTSNLLKELPELCWQCHDEERIANDMKHAAAKTDNAVCTECHPPHSSMKTWLLK